ncbi:hypothetical protein AVEN_163952-1 [Araneus ventricosus]|uniref:Uncharacterized protein n=1 Tax=Araneus ventricosus TaxID=182803 RepID=A0A4Y2GZ65_ARAVE|nr:hypothetical protein AVEN_163952-1 [Araneus ventricosus]
MAIAGLSPTIPAGSKSRHRSDPKPLLNLPARGNEVKLDICSLLRFRKVNPQLQFLRRERLGSSFPFLRRKKTQWRKFLLFVVLLKPGSWTDKRNSELNQFSEKPRE